MKEVKFMQRFFLPVFFLPAFIFNAFISAWAQDDEGTYELEKIIVTATKTEVDQAHVGSSNTVITSGQISQTGDSDVYESLRGLPGIAVSHSGGLGGLTDIYLWGAKPGHTLVMIDGVEANDPMSTDRSFDFAHLPAGNIERIEIIRGPQSTLYGSDAMAGVINIITKKGKGKPKFTVSAESGAHETFQESASLSGSTEKADYSFTLGRFETGGISMAKDGTEKDSYLNSLISSRVGYQISDVTRLNFILRQTYSKTSLDDAAFEDDPNYTAWYRDLTAKIELEQSLKSYWKHKISFSHFEAKRKYRDEPDSVDTTEGAQSWYRGDNNNVEWQHNLELAEWDILTGGFVYHVERGASDSRDALFGDSHLDRKSVEDKGYYLQNQFELKDQLFITPTLRIDDHELFGREVTYKVSSSYLVRPLQTRLKYNIGTGFKAPSIYQLYSTENFGGGPIGDPNLNPDKSKSYDFGFEQELFKRKVSFGAAYFYNNFKNIVDYDLTANKYKNIGRVQTRGIEFSSKLKPAANIDIGLSYTYTRTRDRETGRQLVRRPQNQAGMDLNWLFKDKLNLNWKTVYAGHKWDDSANTLKIKQYSKSDFSLSYGIKKDFKIFGRIDNLLDRNYQEVRGYSTSGRSFYGGFKGEF